MVCTQNIGQSSMSISWEMKWHYKRPLWKGEWQGETCRKASEDFNLHTLICSEHPKARQGEEGAGCLLSTYKTRWSRHLLCHFKYIQLHLFPPTWLWWAFPSRSAGLTWEQPTVTASLRQPLHFSIPAPTVSDAVLWDAHRNPLSTQGHPEMQGSHFWPIGDWRQILPPFALLF